MNIFRYALLAFFPLIHGCYPLDSGIEWRGGPYRLGWIDAPNAVTLSFVGENGQLLERIDRVVFAVGWNGRYLVAKQHPDGNKSVTNYFIIDGANDGVAADPARAVTGPLDAAEFQNMTEQLRLPGFSKTLNSLE